MKKLLGILLCFTAISIIIFSCSKNTDTPNNSFDCTTVSKSFSTDVNPIVQATCNQFGCHATGSFNGPGAITNYQQVFDARVRIREAISSGRMPQGGGLTTAQRNSVLCWLDSGAPNN